MKYKIWISSSKLAFTAKILKKFNVKYFKCESCGYLFNVDLNVSKFLSNKLSYLINYNY